MTSNRSAQDFVAIPRPRVFSRVRVMLIAGLLVLLVVLLFFAWATRDAMSNLRFTREKQKGTVQGGRIVDLHPWLTAQGLASLAVTEEENEYAREAERLADHEVDQAFAAALRQASTEHRVLTGEALQLSKRLEQLQQIVKADQAQVQSLSKPEDRSGPQSGTPGTSSVILATDLDVAKAQLGLDSDELADAQQDLARAVDDQRNKIQQELAAHEAAMRKYDAEAGKEIQAAVSSTQQLGSSLKLLSAWMDQRTRYQLIQQAKQQAQADSATLTAQHNHLEGEANAASSASAASPSPDKATEIASLNARATQRQLLSIYDDRIQTEQQLVTVYGRWSEQLLLQHRIVLHLLLQSLALIALILFSVVVVDALVRCVIERPGVDRRRSHTLRLVFKLLIQLTGLVLILLVVFGAPSQAPTIIGLTTAGITVALQDFILAFLGWFVLMGKNGIRVGDWVEINGISGEVVETGVFRTVLLETGNWTDKGHPTGRRVTLMNNFAIKGQYFNFSTTGQWMWDEITLTIPPAKETYRVVEAIHNVVLKETEIDARLAEQEWKRATHQQGLGQFTAASAVDMRPGVYGIDIIVRYVTRASERFEVRNKLYQSVIALLHKFGTAGARIDVPEPVESLSVEHE